MRHFIVGTAGHVDHGKTELVRALTGRDTDRLKEEKERGISIELGFAPLPLDDDTFLGIIDVPGHERFVKRMVAGAGGIDVAMLLVAADEGVMPQTEEHLEVLRSLAIPCGLVVISKSDLASPDTLPLLLEEVAELTRGTFLEGAPVVQTSARTGEGIDDLRRALADLVRGRPERSPGGPFRLAIDRVFHQKGIGVVITGSGYSGSVATGDALELLPAGRSVRVREVQSFGRARPTAHAGERIAVALQGVKLEDVGRGDVLATPGAFRPTRVFDGRVSLAAYAALEIGNRERVRVHHGAREVMGRIVLLETDTLAAGVSGLAQLLLEGELVVAPGDHFVLRKYSPPRVMGGGVVIDAAPSRHKRFDGDAIDDIRLRERGSPEDVAMQAVARGGLEGVPASDVDRGIADALVASGRVARVGQHLFAVEVLDRLAERIDDLVSEYVAHNPLRWGMDKEELRQRTGFPHGTQAFNAVLEVLSGMRPLFVRGNRVRTGGEDVVLGEAQEAALADLAERVRAAGVAFPAARELEGTWSGRDRFQDAVRLLEDRGELVGVGSDGVIHREALARVVSVVQGLFASHASISVGDVKEALGISRKHAIPLLEHLDAARVTTRSGDARRPGPQLEAPGRE